MKRKFRNLIILFLIGGAYYFIVKCTHFSIHCPIRTITGYLCPGCGVTTMFMAIGKGDFEAAYYANTAVFLGLPFIVFELLYVTVFRERWRNFDRVNNVLLTIYIVILILYCLYRNMWMMA